MNVSLSLSKKTLIFYSIIGLPIMFASAYNLIYGVVLDQTGEVHIGAFSLFGFILVPVALFFTYRNNKCTVNADSLTIGKSEYPFSEYTFKIKEKLLSAKDRPLFSFWRARYQFLVVTERNTNREILVQDMDVFRSDVEQLKARLPAE